jgi:hypothetical protein
MLHGCATVTTKKKKKEGFGSLESRGDRARCRGSGVSYDMMIALSDFCTRAGPCGLRNQLNRPRITGQEFRAYGPELHHRRRHRLPHADTAVFFLLSTESFRRGMGGRHFVYITGVACGSSSRQVLSATGGRHKTRTALLFRAHQPRRGFLLSPLSSNGIALTHRRDRRDAPIDLLSSPHIYHHRDRNR